MLLRHLVRSIDINSTKDVEFIERVLKRYSKYFNANDLNFQLNKLNCNDKIVLKNEPKHLYIDIAKQKEVKKKYNVYNHSFLVLKGSLYLNKKNIEYICSPKLETNVMTIDKYQNHSILNLEKETILLNVYYDYLSPMADTAMDVFYAFCLHNYLNH